MNGDGCGKMVLVVAIVVVMRMFEMIMVAKMLVVKSSKLIPSGH